MPNEVEGLWDVKDLCTRLRVARSTVYDWVHMGYIPHVRLGACVRFRPSEVTEWVRAQAQPGRMQRSIDVEV
jgi:excisionase family DNA binding protein